MQLSPIPPPSLPQNSSNSHYVNRNSRASAIYFCQIFDLKRGELISVSTKFVYQADKNGRD